MNTEVKLIRFLKIDYFCRPVFLVVDMARWTYICDTINLFPPYAKEKEVVKFYSEHPEWLNNLTTKAGGSEGEPCSEVPYKVRLVTRAELKEIIDRKQKLTEITNFLTDINK
jgi:hypothetical protein